MLNPATAISSAGLRCAADRCGLACARAVTAPGDRASCGGALRWPSPLRRESMRTGVLEGEMRSGSVPADGGKKGPATGARVDTGRELACACVERLLLGGSQGSGMQDWQLVAPQEGSEHSNSSTHAAGASPAHT